MDNPRFPHTLSVYRPVKDSSGNVVFDAEGDVTYEKVSLALVSTIDGNPQRGADGAFITSQVETIAFGYRTRTRNASLMGDVAVCDYTLACPMFVTELLMGDVLELHDYCGTKRATVVKATTFNWGSNIWANEIKN